MRFRLEIRVRQTSGAWSVGRLQRPDSLADSENECVMPIGATLSIELDQRLDRDAVHVDNEAIAASIMIDDVHREALQRRPVESADHIRLEVHLRRGDVTVAPLRIVSVPQEIGEVQQGTIRKRVMNQRRIVIVFVSRPAVGPVRPLACTLRVAEAEGMSEPIVVSRAPVKLEETLND